MRKPVIGSDTLMYSFIEENFKVNKKLFNCKSDYLQLQN